MSLITRCPECGTMFKVVADQLKVSQGWVRCGHCAVVFDASVYLLPDDALALAPFILTADVAAKVEPAALPLPSHVESEALPYRLETPQAPASAHDEQAPDRLPPMAPQAEQGVAQGRADALHRASWKQARQEDPYILSQAGNIDVPPRLPELVRTPSVDDSGIGGADVADAKAGDADVAPIGVVNADTQEDVSFVRDARRNAFWRKPLARWSMRMMSILLLVALAFQWTMHNKDTLAAQHPQLSPLLQVLCAVPRCEVQLPRRIESVVIDSSNFNRLGSDLYRLSFALRNTGTIPLALPSLEVTLTDARDQALLRRVLAPIQYGTGTGTGTGTLAAHSALAGAFLMKISDEGPPVNVPPLVSSIPSLPSVAGRVAGYRILAFYP
jgi:predicted Zn finger-like uncharacterized protein